ncbi:MAG: twin-arginine translocation signal domain-containing protein [Candidatus Omnitrophica bacterium]|nr:twin-arginine translocation signal domain-containing protein [Candidatus Omnitrophota bacterium]
MTKLLTRLTALLFSFVLLLPNPALALRPASAQQSTGLEELEQALQKQGGITRRDFLIRVGTAAGATAVTANGLPSLVEGAEDLSAPGKALVDLAKQMGPDRAVTAVVWGDPADLLEIPDFFENAARVGIKSVFVSSKLAELPRAKQQAILDQAKKARLAVLGIIFGNPDWVLESKRADVIGRVSGSLDALLALDWGKEMELTTVFDIEPHAREWRERTGWDGDLSGYSSVMGDVIAPLVSQYRGKFSQRHGRPVFYERLPVISFEPHWWKNGHQTEDGLTIRNVRHPAGIGIAGMTYQPTPQRILSVASRVWERAFPVERSKFLVGVETKPDVVNTLYGQEDKIPGILSGVFDGLPAAAKDRYWGPFLHFGSAGEIPGTRRADQVIRIWAGKHSPASQAAAPAERFGVVENQVKEFVPERIRLQLVIPAGWKGKEKDLVAVAVRRTDTYYVQKKNRETSAFRDIAADGSVTVESDKPLKGEKAAARAVLVLKRADADAFKELYDEGRNQGAYKAAEKYALAIIVVDDEGKTKVVDKLPRAGLEEGVMEVGLSSEEDTFRGILESRADLRETLEREGWIPLNPAQTSGFREGMAGGFVVADSADVTDAGHFVIAESGLTNAAAQELFPWIQVGVGVDRVALEARNAGARAGDLVLVKPAMGISAESVTAQLRVKGYSDGAAPRVVIGDPSQIQALPLRTFQLLAGQQGLPPVVFIGAAVKLTDEAGNVYTLILMA